MQYAQMKDKVSQTVSEALKQARLLKLPTIQ